MNSASDRLTRRAFLRASATAGAAVIAASACKSPSVEGPWGIVDAHTHFYDPTRSQGVPWPPKGDPLLYRPVYPEHWRKLARPLGMGGTVVVEASPWEEDNQWVLDLASREPDLLALVGHLKPGRPEFRESLKRFGAHPLFRGIRTGGWDVPLNASSADLLRDLRLLADRNLALDVLVGPEKLEDISRLAQSLPSLPIVIDHVGNLPIDGKAPPASWVSGMSACARNANVNCKVSGLVEGSGHTDGTAPRDVGFYRPVLDVLWECFGPERLIFGSNWPVSERFASFATVHAVVNDYFNTKGAAAARSYFHDNARRVYRFAERKALSA